MLDRVHLVSLLFLLCSGRFELFLPACGVSRIGTPSLAVYSVRAESSSLFLFSLSLVRLLHHLAATVSKVHVPFCLESSSSLGISPFFDSPLSAFQMSCLGSPKLAVNSVYLEVSPPIRSPLALVRPFRCLAVLASDIRALSWIAFSWNLH